MTNARIPPSHYIVMCVQSFFGWLTVVLSTAVFGTLTIILYFFDKTSVLGHAIGGRGWARSILMMVGVRTRIVNIENIESEKAYIIVANHLSNFDILSLTAHLPLQFRWVSKKELFRIPIMGPAMRAAGYVSIDRQNPEKAWAHLFEARSKLEAGFSLMFFPEGTRSPDGEIKRFKSGAFVLSLHTGLPILPVTIVGSHDIMQKRSFLFRPGKVDLIIHPPISPSGFTIDQKHEFAEVVRDQIAAQLEKSRAERRAWAPKNQTGTA